MKCNFNLFCCISFLHPLCMTFNYVPLFASFFLFLFFLHRSITSTLPNVNLQMPKVPNLTVPNVNLLQMPSFSPPNWIAANCDSECVSVFYSARHAYMYLAWTCITTGYVSRVSCSIQTDKGTKDIGMTISIFWLKSRRFRSCNS